MDETYQEMRERFQREVDATLKENHVFFAFSEEQLEKALAEHGLRREDVVSGPLGMLGPIDGIFGVTAVLMSHNNELHRRLISDDKFAEEAFLAEMWNHEYMYAEDNDDVLGVFNLSEHRELSDDEDTWLISFIWSGDNKEVPGHTVDAFFRAYRRYYDEV